MRRHVLILLTLLAVTIGIASPAFGSQPAARHMVPDEDQRPVVHSASIAPPQRHNDLLEVDLEVSATDEDGIAAYQYRWVGSTSSPIFTVDATGPTVSYRSVEPDSRQRLQVRAIDAGGLPSDWYDAWAGSTPPVPNLIVAGDSIASGYTRQWFTSPGTCVDADASYGRTIRTSVARSLPAQWSPTYVNVAWAGAGVHAVVNGGTDSCGVYRESQLDAIAAATDGETWNTVVVTAGINSTNWSSVIVDLTRNTAFSLTERGDRGWCEVGVRDRWNIGERADGITTAVRNITSTLARETNADVYWTSYYGITDTRLAPGWTPIGAECDEEMSVALNRLHTAIRLGLHGSVTWVDIDRSTVQTQGWAGWPHPNRDGHVAIGNQIAAAIG